MKSDAQVMSSLSDIFDVPQKDRPLPQDKPLLLLEDTTGGKMFLVEVDPCKFLPIADAPRFKFGKKDGKKHCEDTAAAQRIVNEYEDLRLDDPKAAETLTAADLFNVACAYLWRARDRAVGAVQAYNLLKEARASAKGATRTAIEKKIMEFEPITPGTPRSRRQFERDLDNAGLALDEVQAWMIEKADLG